MASPFLYVAKDPQKEIIDPAVNGMRNVFKSVEKNDVKVSFLSFFCSYFSGDLLISLFFLAELDCDLFWTSIVRWIDQT